MNAPYRWSINVVIGTTLLNRYRIDAELGHGGMGLVYRGHDLWLDRPVAVKVINRPGLDDEHHARLRREARAAAKLNHPNIISVFDINESGGMPFIVMELLDGQTLREAGPFSLAQVMQIAGQLCNALEHAHTRGIVHRDLKPENVMLVQVSGRPSVKLMDLGLALARGAPSITGADAVVGTALYMAPEQSQGQNVDGRADLYALGVMLFELCTGRRPYNGDDVVAVLMQHWTAPIPSLTQANPAISPALESVVQKLLAKKPEHRFQTAGEVYMALLATPEAGSDALLAPVMPSAQAPTQMAVMAMATLAPSTEITFEEWPLDPVPHVPELIGRESELARGEARLNANGLLVLEGMAGAGKTTLGAALARRQLAHGRAVLWVSLDPTGKNSAEAIYWDVAAYLARDGKPELWSFLREEARMQESPDARPRDRARRLGLLLACLQRGCYTIGLDNVHVLARGAEAEFAHLFGELRKRIENRPDAPPAQLIIMARELAPAIRQLSDGPFSGFSAADALRYLDAHSVQLPAGAFEALHAKVAGNPLLLRLCLPGLQARCDDPAALARFIDGLAGQQNVRDFLIESLPLSADEQLVVEALAVFNAPAPRDAIEELLADREIGALHDIIDRLVRAHQAEESPETGDIALHALVRDYSYARIDRARRLQLHARAAAYLRARRAPLATAYHYRMARDYEAAARLLVHVAPELMRSGRLDALLEQIAPLEREQVGDEIWPALSTLRGTALYRRGAYDEAVEAFSEALLLAEPATQAVLHNRLGWCWQARGRFADALAAYHRQLALAESLSDTAQAAEAQLGIGRVLSRRGEFDDAVRHLQEAARIGERSGDSLLAARAQGNLGLVYQQRGRLDEALESGQRALDAFRRARRVDYVANALGNLGVVHHVRHEHERAAAYYQQAIQIYEQVGDPYYLVMAYNNLGELRIAQGQPQDAIAELSRSTTLAEQTGNDYMLAVACANLAEAHLALGRVADARAAAIRAVDLARTVGVPQQEGIARAKLGETLARSGRAADAASEFEAAVSLLAQAGNKPELARALRAYGESLLAGDAARGRARLNEARALYVELGSTAEADKLSAILSAYPEAERSGGES
ncbi:MAG: tetratricopeptide repeat protein [Chloroflexi bacterium]|nr:tetratricopeptide repeat protein [Chloroflexota bacterium]